MTLGQPVFTPPARRHAHTSSSSPGQSFENSSQIIAAVTTADRRVERTAGVVAQDGDVAIGGAENAGILAAQILALGDAKLSARLERHKAEMAAKVTQKDAALQTKVGKLLGG